MQEPDPDTRTVPKMEKTNTGGSARWAFLYFSPTYALYRINEIPLPVIFVSSLLTNDTSQSVVILSKKPICQSTGPVRPHMLSDRLHCLGKEPPWRATGETRRKLLTTDYKKTLNIKKTQRQGMTRKMNSKKIIDLQIVSNISNLEKFMIILITKFSMYLISKCRKIQCQSQENANNFLNSSLSRIPYLANCAVFSCAQARGCVNYIWTGPMGHTSWNSIKMSKFLGRIQHYKYLWATRRPVADTRLSQWVS